MIEYVIDKANHLYRVRMTGCNSAADLARHYSRVLDDPHYNPNFDTITYIDDEAGGPILAELPETGRMIEAMAQMQQGRKWAVVMSPGFQRTIVEFLLIGVKLGSARMRFFDNEALALAWLGQARPAGVARQAH